MSQGAGSPSPASRRSWARAPAPPGRGARRGAVVARRHRRAAGRAPGVRHRELDLTRARLRPAAARRAPRGGRGHGRARRVLHQPAARRPLRARAGVDRHPEPRWPPRPRPACGTWSCAPSPPSTARAARTRASSPRTAPLQPEPAPGLGARQAGGGAARGLASRGAIPDMTITVLRFAPLLRPGRAHLLHAHLRPPRGAGADGLRPAGAAPASRRRADAALAWRSSAAPRGAFNVVPSAAHPAAHRAPPGGQDPGARAAPARLRGRGPAVGGGAGRGARAASSTTCATCSWPTARRRARELGFDAAPLEPRRARGAYLRYRTRGGRAAGRRRPAHERARRSSRSPAGAGGRRGRSRLPSGPRSSRSSSSRELRASRRAQRGEGLLVALARACSRARAPRLGEPGRLWSALYFAWHSEDVDEFGYDPKFTRDDPAASSSSCTRCGGAWRPRGSRTCPREGPALIVANHSGVLPWDGIMINLAVRHEHPARRAVPHARPRHVRAAAVPGPAARAERGGARQPGERRAAAARGRAGRRLPGGREGRGQAASRSATSWPASAAAASCASPCARARPSSPARSWARRRSTR